MEGISFGQRHVRILSLRQRLRRERPFEHIHDNESSTPRFACHITYSLICGTLYP